MKKLCIIYNFAQHYRTGIFVLIDKTFNCDFLFGDSMGDVKKMDYNLLNGNILETHTRKIGAGWYWQPKVVSQLWKPYSHYILLGETRALSTWIFCIFAKLFFWKKKIYFWSHGWYGKETRSETLVKKILFKLPNGGIFLYGNYARNLMIKERFNPKKLFVIHNSLAYDEQKMIRQLLTPSHIFLDHFGNCIPTLIFIGRLTPIKKLDLIIDALLLLKKKGKLYNLVLVGDGSERHRLEKLVEEADLTRQVWFYGACYDEMTNAELIYNADLCVAPGNVGLTAMHVMMFGTPVLTHNSFEYQMPEFEAISDGETGCFFQKDNVESLVESIENWFAHHNNEREKVRQACYHEIDTQWTPLFQMKVIKSALS